MQKRRVGELKTKKAPQNEEQKKSNKIFKIVLVLFSLVLILFLIQPFAKGMKTFFKNTAKSTVKVLSRTVGTPMVKDTFWNINMLLVWYGWDGHGGGYLADTTIVASWDPELWTISMLSIPRDLYINNPLWGTSRINSVFTQYYWRTKDLHEAASWYVQLVEKVTGLTIPYYATIDFSWFKKLVDDIWGIDIDVPYALHDYQYPDDRLKWYDPLHVEEGWQHMDGKLALKYARSRHAAWHASDFDRSFRQQLVINAIKDKLLSGDNLSLSNAKNLYENYIQMVNTNVSLNEMLWGVQFLENTKMFTFWLNVSFVTDSLATQKGSFLYTPQRELFNWASVLLPIGSYAWKLDNFDAIHQYTDFVTHNQKFSLEDATIEIDNGITKETLREYGLSNVRVAGRLAAKMKRFWLNVVDTENVDPQDWTTVIINTESDDEEWYEGTVNALRNFLPIDQVIYNTGTVKVIIDDYGNSVEVFTWKDIQVVLWTTYLQELQNTKFRSDELIIQYRDE